MFFTLTITLFNSCLPGINPFPFALGVSLHPFDRNRDFSMARPNLQLELCLIPARSALMMTQGNGWACRVRCGPPTRVRWGLTRCPLSFLWVSVMWRSVSEPQRAASLGGGLLSVLFTVGWSALWVDGAFHSRWLEKGAGSWSLSCPVGDVDTFDRKWVVVVVCKFF